MVKNAKKRALSEGAVQKVAFQSGDSNKSFKKKKFENAGGTQNGQALKDIKQESPKKPNKGNVQNKEAVLHSPKNAQKQKPQQQTVGTKEAKLEKLKKIQESREKRKLVKQETGESKPNKPVIEMSAEQIKERILELLHREKLSKTGKRKLASFKKKLSILQGGIILPIDLVAKKETKTDKSVEASKKKKVQSKVELTKKAEPEKIDAKMSKNMKKKEKPGSLLLIKQNIEDDDNDDDEEKMKSDDCSGKFLETDTSDDSESDDDDDDDDDDEDDDSDDSESDDQDKDEDDDEKDEDEDENEDEDEEKKVDSKLVNEQAKPAAKAPQIKENENQEGKKKRYVLFVGNLPYSATSAEIEKHFSTAGTVSSVRIPTKPGTNTPRGFAYVEFNNSTDYEKALSLDHTFIQGRRINVQYSAPGSKDVNNKREVVAKNLKLQALKKAGKLAGSENKGFQKNNWKKGKRNSK